MHNEQEQIDRHTPLGIFHLAEAFCRSAVFLMEARASRKIRLRFADLIGYQLHSHSIELLLKAFLRSRGISNDDLRNKYRHYLDRLWKDCRKHGLRTKWWRRLGAVVYALNEHVNNQTFRYYQTGCLTLPDIAIVRAMNEELVSVVRRVVGAR